MIKFFRKIRQKLLTENKFSKYLLYAVGEIVLVVIGILIALNINNQNEQRIKKEKLDAIYIEVQRELAQNIKKTTTIIDFYEKKDSIVYLALNDKLTKEDYIKNPSFAHVIRYYQVVNIQNKGYLNLMDKLDILPTSFKPILEKINIVYESNKSSIDAINEDFTQFMRDDITKMADTKSWYVEFAYKGNFNDEILEYLVNDPFYKNKVFEYNIYYENLKLQAFKVNAVKAYKALSEVTGKKGVIDASLYFQTDEELSKYVGEFKINSNDILFNEEEGDNIINIKLKDSQLYCILFGDIEVDIFPHTENVFILGDRDNAKYTFFKNENGQIIGFQLFNESVYTDWTRAR
jgi:hypothetical protein